MLDILATERFITVTDLKTGAHATLESHKADTDFGRNVLRALVKDFTFDYAKLETTESDIDFSHRIMKILERDGSFVEADIERVEEIFRELVEQDTAAYMVYMEEDGTVTTVGSDWDRMFLRANELELEALEKKLKTIELTQEQVAILKHGDIFDDYFNGPQVELQVLKALEKGHISQFQAAKLLDFTALRERDNSYQLQLKNNDGSICEEDWNCFVTSLTDLSDSEIEKVKHAVLQLPPEETQCFMLGRDRVLRPEHAWHKDYTLYDLVWEAGQPLKGEVKLEDGTKKYFFYVLPPTLHQKVMHSLFANNVMLANPVCGALSKPEDFETPTTRDVLIPCSFFKSPDRVHDVTAEALSIMVHDVLGHLWFEGATPRVPLIRVAMLFRHTDPFIWNLFLDRLSPIDNELGPNEDFWRRICYMLSSQKKEIGSARRLKVFYIILNDMKENPLIYKRYRIGVPSKAEIKTVEKHLEFWRRETPRDLLTAISNPK